MRFGGAWIADSERTLLLFEPGHYPMAYFPVTDISLNTLHDTEHTTRHPDLGLTSWYAVEAGEKKGQRGAWQHTDLPAYASELEGRVAFSWPAKKLTPRNDIACNITIQMVLNSHALAEEINRLLRP